MKRIPVTSSCIASLGYDSKTHILEIEFTNDGIYRYLEVPASVYRQLLSAESRGTYFNQEIKSKYEFSVIRKPSS
jgi:hypothetical protein